MRYKPWECRSYAATPREALLFPPQPGRPVENHIQLLPLRLCQRNYQKSLAIRRRHVAVPADIRHKRRFEKEPRRAVFHAIFGSLDIHPEKLIVADEIQLLSIAPP